MHLTYRNLLPYQHYRALLNLFSIAIGLVLAVPNINAWRRNAASEFSIPAMKNFAGFENFFTPAVINGKPVRGQIFKDNGPEKVIFAITIWGECIRDDQIIKTLLLLDNNRISAGAMVTIGYL
jgi:hypothetical protein